MGRFQALPWAGETDHQVYFDGYLLHSGGEPYLSGGRPAIASKILLGEAFQDTRTGTTRGLSQPDREVPSGQGDLGAAILEAAEGPQPAAGAISERRETFQYEVAPGDTVSTIAERFGISTETVLLANNLRDADFIRLGQSLVILPISGLLHTVEKGDSLLYLASRYGVDTEEIVGYGANNISDPNSLAIGQKLIIPGGTMPSVRASTNRGGARPAAESPAPAPGAPARAASAAASGQFIWPNAGRITQYFSGAHSGLDIAAPYGTPVAAADGGVVVDRAALSWGLGWYVTLDHGNGYSTTYSHLSSFAVGIGERVDQGDMVGRVGSTGLSTGPHNHFVVKRNGVPINPLNVLP